MSTPKSSAIESNWYRTEINTERLVKAVISERGVSNLSAEDIWWLFQLTWITKGTRHWKKLKLPALAHILKRGASFVDDLQASLESMELSEQIANAAAKTTGFVNAYPAYRNSLKRWCRTNKTVLHDILNAAHMLASNDQARFDLALKLEKLPPVPTPSGARTMAASNLITPLIACLDPKKRFPVINGKEGLKKRLVRLGLANRSLDDQVRGFIGLIGQFGLTDSFAVDTMSEAQIKKIVKRRRIVKNSVSGTPLFTFDEDERKALQKSANITYRNRHNKMTNRLRRLFPRHKLYTGSSPDCRYDVLIANYDGMGRDLLVEVKPDPDKGSIRVAIGQLLDYRRFLPNQAATDLAILTISSPTKDYIGLMQDLQITPLWFINQNCELLSGNGKIFRTLEVQLKTAAN